MYIDVAKPLAENGSKTSGWIYPILGGLGLFVIICICCSLCICVFKRKNQRSGQNSAYRNGSFDSMYSDTSR
jgi:hypothetical protein